MKEQAVNQAKPVRVRLLPKIQELIIIMTQNTKNFDLTPRPIPIPTPTPPPNPHPQWPPHPRAFEWLIVNVDYKFACASMEDQEKKMGKMNLPAFPPCGPHWWGTTAGGATSPGPG